MKTMFRILAAVAAVTIVGCSPAGQGAQTTRRGPVEDSLPPMKVFPARAHGLGVAMSNADLARDILDLTFQLESGKEIARLTRFEGPVSIVPGQELPPQMSADLDALLARLRDEARIDITRGTDPKTANILVWPVPRERLQRAVPQAACFVVPRVSSWEEFIRSRSSGRLDWGTLDRRDRVSVFIPADVAPQEARDCLHEEIAQALGPVNDLYRLGESIFNDDNIQTTLTAYDMTVLRAYYDPSIRNGMTREEVAAVLDGVLARVNPRGRALPARGTDPSPRSWIKDLETALSGSVGSGRRIAAARRAVRTATARGWQDNRLGFALYVYGRLSLGVDSRRALDSFRKSHALYARIYGRDDIHTAHVAMQLAAFSLSEGQAEQAVMLVNESLPAVLRTENAALLASLLMLKAEALDFLGKSADARVVRLDSMGWARYGFGPDQAVKERAAEIAALTPRRTAQATQRRHGS